MVRNQSKYLPKRISHASDPEVMRISPGTRFGTRLAQFAQLVEKLRGTAFYAGLLESSALTRAERACHARIVGYADACLVWLLNDSELGQRLRAAAAKDPKLTNSSILKGESEAGSL